MLAWLTHEYKTSAVEEGTLSETSFPRARTLAGGRHANFVAVTHLFVLKCAGEGPH